MLILFKNNNNKFIYQSRLYELKDKKTDVIIDIFRKQKHNAILSKY
jgi:hypothetical protein